MIETTLTHRNLGMSQQENVNPMDASLAALDAWGAPAAYRIAFEAQASRDLCLRQLAEATASMRHKMTTIDSLLERNAALEQQIARLEEQLSVNYAGSNPRTRRNSMEWIGTPRSPTQTRSRQPSSALSIDTSLTAVSFLGMDPANPLSRRNSQLLSSLAISAHNSSEKLQAPNIMQDRLDVLAALPLPEDVPTDTVKPIVIPAPFTLHDLFKSLPASHKAMLGQYRVLQDVTTSWCPEREEHGYFLTSLYKCKTNPKVSSAHLWSKVDVLESMNQPTACFYQKDGNWYYAGAYVALSLEALTAQEWTALSHKATQAIIKDTLADRKNVSPANTYEITQLYTCGALRVACVGLQCVRFNQVLYNALLDHADQCHKTGSWRPRTRSSGSIIRPSPFLRSGITWNSNAGFITAERSLSMPAFGSLRSNQGSPKGISRTEHDENTP